MPTPRKSRAFGGSAAHQRLMMANLAASLFGATAIVGAVFVPGSLRTRIRLARLPGMVAEVARQRAIVGAWLAALAIGLPWGAVAGLFPLFGTGIGLALCQRIIDEHGGTIGIDSAPEQGTTLTVMLPALGTP